MTNYLFTVERWAILGMGIVFFMYFSSLKLIAYRWNAKLVKPLHVTFMRWGLCLSVVTIIWGVDDRGAFGIYPIPLLVVIEDLFGSIAFFCLTRWLAGIYLTINTQARNNKFPPELIPNIISFALFVVCDTLAIYLNLSWFRRFLLFYWAVFCIVAAIAMLVALFNITKIFSAVKESNVSHTRTAEQQVVVRKLRFGIVGVLIVAAFDIASSLQIFRASKLEKSLQVDVSIEDPDAYSRFPSPGVFCIIMLLISYASFIPFKQKLQRVFSAEVQTGESQPGDGR